jgi:hypothetical protein
LSGRVSLGLFIHSHQPVGNYDWVFAEHWHRCYRPMLVALAAHPQVRATLHYSGPLIDWLTANRPEFAGMVARLVGRGQVELAGGGYYEPILAMLPEADRQGQVRFMADELERRWGQRPQGAWLTERVWEPHLAPSLARADVRYTLTDDSHFYGAGLELDEMDSHYLTEDDGQALAIFAGPQATRSLIPWRPVEEVIEWLRAQIRDGRDRLFCMGDDGEKFGGWPNTYEYCWEEGGGWVERFFTALEREGSWLRTVKLGDWLASQPPKGPVYLPTASYQEMEEWSLPPDAVRRRRAFRASLEKAGIAAEPLRPGFWRNYLVRYPEVGAMHARIRRTRALLDAAPRSAVHEQAERELWMGECNCPFWHGIFGGVYLRHIRLANLRHLARAERLVREAAAANPATVCADFDLDGRAEVILYGRAQRLLVDPDRGGALLEWDLHDGDWPLLSVIARRPEAYHDDLQQGARSISPGAAAVRPQRKAALVYDAASRGGLQERLLAAGATERAWRSGKGDSTPLTAAWMVVRAGPDGAGVVLEAEFEGLRIRKTLRQGARAGLRVSYRFENRTGRRLHRTAVSEWNFGLPGQDEAPGRESIAAADGRVTVNAGGFLALEARTRGCRAAWSMPVETVSSSEKGVEVSYQGLCVAFPVSLDLLPGEAHEASLAWSVVRRRVRGGRTRRGEQGAG